MSTMCGVCLASPCLSRLLPTNACALAQNAKTHTQCSSRLVVDRDMFMRLDIVISGYIIFWASKTEIAYMPFHVAQTHIAVFTLGCAHVSGNASDSSLPRSEPIRLPCAKTVWRFFPFVVEITFENVSIFRLTNGARRIIQTAFDWPTAMEWDSVCVRVFGKTINKTQYKERTKTKRELGLNKYLFGHAFLCSMPVPHCVPSDAFTLSPISTVHRVEFIKYTCKHKQQRSAGSSASLCAREKI